MYSPLAELSVEFGFDGQALLFFFGEPEIEDLVSPVQTVDLRRNTVGRPLMGDWG